MCICVLSKSHCLNKQIVFCLKLIIWFFWYLFLYITALNCHLWCILVSWNIYKNFVNSFSFCFAIKISNGGLCSYSKMFVIFDVWWAWSIFTRVLTARFQKHNFVFKSFFKNQVIFLLFRISDSFYTQPLLVSNI